MIVQLETEYETYWTGEDELENICILNYQDESYTLNRIDSSFAAAPENGYFLTFKANKKQIKLLIPMHRIVSVLYV